MKQKHFIEVPLVKHKKAMEEEAVKSNIRRMREKFCFPYINRGRLWYNRLSDMQLAELSRWYQAWLDAPATKVIPKEPSWLNKKLNDEDIL